MEEQKVAEAKPEVEDNFESMEQMNELFSQGGDAWPTFDDVQSNDNAEEPTANDQANSDQISSKQVSKKVVSKDGKKRKHFDPDLLKKPEFQARLKKV